ncbi:hypothetical protein S3E15_02904 [Bacillus mycoides]|uniref:Uncharacterized protein n=1 Tax=Bacillus mycoides TaxID=1405 RepID=A0AAP7W587_BACMY|nr:hypothetical protein S3E15_02904 [Bacillus mycoides]OSY02831.1 hypothetical protein S2E19_03329 [Bacillus mycoides]
MGYEMHIRKEIMHLKKCSYLFFTYIMKKSIVEKLNKRLFKTFWP